MKIKKNDTVKVRAGKDKGKSGKILRVYPNNSRVVVEGVNLIVKHVRAGKRGEGGQRMYVPGRMPLAKVQLVCPHCGQSTRIAHHLIEGARQKKERVCKKCKTAI